MRKQRDRRTMKRRQENINGRGRALRSIAGIQLLPSTSTITIACHHHLSHLLPLHCCLTACWLLCILFLATCPLPLLPLPPALLSAFLPSTPPRTHVQHLPSLPSLPVSLLPPVTFIQLLPSSHVCSPLMPCSPPLPHGWTGQCQFMDMPSLPPLHLMLCSLDSFLRFGVAFERRRIPDGVGRQAGRRHSRMVVAWQKAVFYILRRAFAALRVVCVCQACGGGQWWAGSSFLPACLPHYSSCCMPYLLPLYYHHYPTCSYLCPLLPSSPFPAFYICLAASL